ncbi:murein L,D-transpeptidase [Nocardioides marmoriginsengisoli]|uniref:Murein L,D-transpeptidase n=2 Tax=Nocardioides marmoriginsengisoli TaxID=661483 RepID=A0A3N0CGZ5_9ACTN|nr:murein L,D-transpeptidase [Nocardioides marmoriginsengisoli]
MFVVLLLAVGALGYGVAAATGQLDGRASAAAVPGPTPAVPTIAHPEPSRPVTPVVPADPPPPPVLEPGDTGPQVRALQSRLRELAWFSGKVTDSYGPKTTAAVKGFQGKRGLPKLGYVDAATMKRLKAMTRTPTKDDLANRISDGTWTNAPLDARCRTGRALCIDKTSRTIRWVVDGQVRKTMAVRFGSSYTPTREGLFHIESKSPNHVSSLYGSAMPFAMFFSRGQAVHYSSDFAATGYSGASHGCVNVRDYDGLQALFDQVRVGDKAVVYWS